MSKESRRAELEAELASLDDVYEADVDMTVCIVAGSVWRTINPVLEALSVQGVRMDIIVFTDSRLPVDDPTRAILKACTTYLPPRSDNAVRNFVYDGDIPFKSNLDSMVSQARSSAAADAETEWIFFLDADVLLDPGTLRSLCNIVKEDNVGAWCVRYNHVTGHEQWGGMLMRTKVAREVGFSGLGQCGCKNLKADLKARGLEMVRVEGLSAQHLKRGLIRTVVIGG